MTSWTIGTDTFVITGRGPALADELDPRTDEVMVVRGGTLGLARLRGLEVGAGKCDAWRFLTPVGDIVVSEGSSAVTRDGPLAGRDIASRLEACRPVRLEVLHPRAVHLKASSKRGELRNVYRQCLRSLPRPVVQVPRNGGVDEAVEDRLQRCLREAGVKFHRFEDERWLVFTFDTDYECAWDAGASPAENAETLIALTAWGVDEATVTCRTRYEDTRLRRRLLAALVSDQRAFQVKWLPGYFPVEARVRTGAALEMRPFVPVQAARPEHVPTMRLEVSEGGHLVVGLAVIAPSPA